MRMRFLSAGLFAQTNRHHLQQTGCDTCRVLRMCLHATENDHAVSLGDEIVEMRDRAGFAGAERVRVHVGMKWRTNCLLSYAEPTQNFSLTFRRRATMTAHRRNNERIAASGFHCIDNSREQ